MSRAATRRSSRSDAARHRLKEAAIATDRYAALYRDFRWEVPARFNIAAACCTRWAGDPERIALHWEDEGGEKRSYRYREIQQAANRLSNALAALGVRRGDRVAIIMPQRPETAIAYMAIFQMGAVAVPLSFLFGPDALEFRLANAGVSVALAEPGTLQNLLVVRDKLPALRHVVGAGGATGPDVLDWDALLAKAASDYRAVDTAATDPALIIYTSGTTGAPKGALLPHQALIGNLPGFVHSHDFFPVAGDIFWSPADWAWTGGLMDALLPTWYFGMPLLGYRGRFDAERAFDLMERYAIRNAFLFPTALKTMMKAVPRPRERYRLPLRSMMSGGESLGTTVLAWAREELGVTINEIFGQTEINYVVGNCQAAWPVKPGSIGRPYPGHRVAVVDATGQPLAAGELGEIAVHRAWQGGQNPIFFLGYWDNAEATRAKYLGDWCTTGDLGHVDEDGYLWYRGRSDDVIKSSGYRIGPAEIESCLVRHEAVANAAVIGLPDAERGQIVKAYVVLQPGRTPSAGLEDDIRAHVRAKLAPYQYPKEIEFIDTLPMTTTGKVQRKELRARDAARARNAD